MQLDGLWYCQVFPIGGSHHSAWTAWISSSLKQLEFQFAWYDFELYEMSMASHVEAAVPKL
jgi:hypothetical protein